MENTLLDDYILKVLNFYNIWLIEEKEKTRSWVNSKMQEFIAKAEENIKKEQLDLLTILKERMQKLEDKRKKETHEIMKKMCDEEEQFLKKDFERSIESSNKNWSIFIENCKKQIT
jgi:23S rRNA pseudoU1915 N3-methylase RlmH